MTISRPRYQKKKRRKSKFKQGFYVPKNMEKYRQPIDKTMNESIYPFMRSSWEKKFASWCDNNSKVKYWGCEVIHIKYYDTLQQKARRYFPDFFLEMEDGKKIIVEIKPKNQTHLQNNIDKWNAATLFCKQKGIEFIVMTEKELGIR